MRDAARPKDPDRAFLILLTPLTAVSLPSLVYCALELTLWLHSSVAGRVWGPDAGAATGWGALAALEDSVYSWIMQWNSLATLAATGFFIAALTRPKWRHWAGLALIPYGVLLCADFTLRWRSALMP